MRKMLFSAWVLATALGGLSAVAQPPAGQERGDRMGGGRMSPALSGAITATADLQFTVKADTGQSYTVLLTAETRLMEMGTMPQRQAGDQGQQRPSGGLGGQAGPGGTGRPSLKASDFKAGDVVSVMGSVDANAHSVAATMVMKLDAARAKQMQEQQASFGKSWLAGKLTAVDELTLTLLGTADNAPHSFAVDENTAFRKRGEPATLADFVAGDTLRVEGAIKDGQFVATSVSVGVARKAAQPATQSGSTAKSDQSSGKADDDSTQRAKSKKSSSSSSDSNEDDGPPPDGPPPGEDGPPPGGGGPPPGGFGGASPMNF